MADRKRAQKQRRRERKNVPIGHAHIQATFNNTIVKISAPNGNVVAWAAACLFLEAAFMLQDTV